MPEVVNLLCINLPQFAQNGTIKEPDSFDSTDLQKLINFISQCQLMFYASPDIYHNDDQKVSFTITYFHEAALDFFELYLIDLIDTSDW